MNHRDATEEAPPRLTLWQRLQNVKTADEIALWFLRTSGFVSLIFVALVLLMGFMRMVEGTGDFFGFGAYKGDWTWRFWQLVRIESSKPDQSAAISKLVSGLEFFLLAPLAYLQLRTLGNYVAQILISSEGQPSPNVTRSLMSVKALSVGLLITILATHTVGIFLEADSPSAHAHSVAGGDENAVFPWVKIAASTGFLLALTAYFAMLEFMCKEGNGSE